MKSARSLSTSSNAVMSCMVTTTDSTSPSSSERNGVTLSRMLTDRPSGTLRTTSSARSLSLVLSSREMGNSARETFPPVGAADDQDLEEVFRGTAGQLQDLCDPHRLLIEGKRRSCPRVEDRHAHG